MRQSRKSGGTERQETPRGRPTLKTIAYMTGLGVTTVSRALKDAPDIAEKTKERVRLVAKQLGYMPNRAGVRLRTGKTNVIALLLAMDEEIMGMTSQMIFGISDILAETPFHLVLMPQSPASDPMVPLRYVLDTGSADGVIISRIAPDDSRIRLLLERNFPFAAHGRTESPPSFPFHDFDNDAFAYEAVEHLVKRGRKRIACLQPPGHLTYYRSFRSGFERGLHDLGAEEVPLTSVNTDSPLIDIREALIGMLSTRNRPDGIICSSGGSAIAIMTAIKACNLALGTDIDLVSKQASDFLNWVNPEVITMSEDFRQAGRELARGVLSRIEQPASTPVQSISRPNWQKGARQSTPQGSTPQRQ